jgi:hypothetical protein
MMFSKGQQAAVFAEDGRFGGFVSSIHAGEPVRHGSENDGVPPTRVGTRPARWPMEACRGLLGSGSAR